MVWENFVPSDILLQNTVLLNFIARMLAKFTQLKRNKRFDNFIMLVGVQGSLHIAAGSHPVQKAWGSQGSLYIGPGA